MSQLRYECSHCAKLSCNHQAAVQHNRDAHGGEANILPERSKAMMRENDLVQRRTIATLTAQLAEARAMAGADIERAAELVRFYPQTMLMLPEQERVCEYLAELIPRALDPDAAAALAEYVRPLQDEVKRLREGLAEIAAMPDYRLPKAQDRARALLEGAKP